MTSILERFLCVKSIVAILLTIAFVIMCCLGNLDERFITIYAIVISFYFGQQAGTDAIETFFTQSEKALKSVDDEVNDDEWQQQIKF